MQWESPRIVWYCLAFRIGGRGHNRDHNKIITQTRLCKKEAPYFRGRNWKNKRPLLRQWYVIFKMGKNGLQAENDSLCNMYSWNCWCLLLKEETWWGLFWFDGCSKSLNKIWSFCVCAILFQTYKWLFLAGDHSQSPKRGLGDIKGFSWILQ